VGGLTSLFAQRIQLTVNMSGPYRFSRWQTKFPAQVTPNKQSASVTIADMYAEESRDLVFEIHIPAIPEPKLADELFSVSGHYWTPGQLGTLRELPVVTLAIDRPQGVAPDVRADFELDRQRNRIQTAVAMERAAALCEERKFPQAQQLIKDTIAAIAASVSGNDPFCQAQCADLRACASRLVDHSSYQSSGKAFAMQQQQQQWTQRTSYQPASASAMMYSNASANAWSSRSEESTRSRQQLQQPQQQPRPPTVAPFFGQPTLQQQHPQQQQPRQQPQQQQPQQPQQQQQPSRKNSNDMTE